MPLRTWRWYDIACEKYKEAFYCTILPKRQKKKWQANPQKSTGRLLSFKEKIPFISRTEIKPATIPNHYCYLRGLEKILERAIVIHVNVQNPKSGRGSGRCAGRWSRSLKNRNLFFDLPYDRIEFIQRTSLSRSLVISGLHITPTFSWDPKSSTLPEPFIFGEVEFAARLDFEPADGSLVNTIECVHQTINLSEYTLHEVRNLVLAASDDTTGRAGAWSTSYGFSSLLLTVDKEFTACEGKGWEELT